MIAVSYSASVQCRTAFNSPFKIPNDPPRMGRKVLLLAIIPVPPQTLYTPPMLVQCWASVADFGPTLKQHWVKVSFEKYLVISLVADIIAVSLYSIVYCRPTRHRPTHARFAVEWIFKHVLEKKVCL